MIVIVASILIIIDQYSKYLIIKKLGYGQSLPIIPNIFHLTPISNTGIAFGLFKGNNTILIFSSILVILTLAIFWKRIVPNRLFLGRMAIGLIIGGAVGNLIDRIRFRHVVDFLDFRIWPVFNFADSGITIGTVLLFIVLIFWGNKYNGDRKKESNIG